MPRATTTRHPATAPAPDTPEQIGAAIITVLAAIERLPEGSPAAAAYRAALRRKAQALAEAGGPAALTDVLFRVRTEAPDRADARESILTTAWADLPEWHS